MDVLKNAKLSPLNSFDAADLFKKFTRIPAYLCNGLIKLPMTIMTINAQKTLNTL